MISVSRGQVHESVIHIQDKGSVLTWDFDVMHHDIVFSVFRLASTIKVPTTATTQLAVKNSTTGTTSTTAPTVGTTQTGSFASN